MKAVWTDIFRLGAEVHHPSRPEPLKVSKAFVDAIMKNFQRLTGEGHQIVVLREHERKGHDYGTVHNLRVADGYVQAQVEFSAPDDRLAYNEGRLRRFSPGFALDFQHPHTGENIGPTLLEVSYTAMPFQTNLRPPQETNPGLRLAMSFPGIIATLSEEESMSNETKAAADAVEPKAVDVALADGAEEEEEEFNLKAAFEGLSSQLSSLLALMSPAEEEEEEEEGPKLSDAERELVSLRATVERLEDERTKLELSARGIEPDSDLILLARTNRGLFDSVTAKLASAAPAGQKPIGRMGDAEVSGSLTPAQILAQAKEAGKELHTGHLAIWLSRTYPDQREVVLELARQK